MSDETTTTRTDTDLDNIEIGTPSKGGLKLYYDARTQTHEEMVRRIDAATVWIEHAKNRLQGTPQVGQ